MSALTPSLAQLIRAAVEKRTADLRVSLPATVVSFDVATQLARVRPDIFEIKETVDGDTQPYQLPDISNVPCVIPSSGHYALTLPVSAGDKCLLVFADRSLDDWITHARAADPEDERRHALSDAIAILGIRSKATALSGYSTTRAELGHESGPKVAVSQTDVQLGVSSNEQAIQSAILGTQFLTDLYVCLNAVAAAIPLGGNVPATAAVTVLSNQIAAHLSTKVKLK